MTDTQQTLGHWPYVLVVASDYCEDTFRARLEVIRMHWYPELLAALQRVQEELDEATSMRQEAETLEEVDMIAECKAAEDGLRVFSST